jgi:formiminotetrahydrofolate cyclodeaminase
VTELLEDVQLARMSLAHSGVALAAAAPRPAGSCASPVPGALAAGLVAKVARLSAQSDPFGDLAFDMEDVASEADLRRAQLLHLADEDRDGFDRVMVTRRLPSATPEQRAVRRQEIQRAYEAAVEPPLRASCS